MYKNKTNVAYDVELNRKLNLYIKCFTNFVIH